MKPWKLVSTDEFLVDELARQTGLPVPVVAILVARGYAAGDSIERFLKPRLSDLSDPFLLSDMTKAVERILAAIGSKQLIAVYGDYDADGVTSTALMVRVLGRLGARVCYFLPNRMDEGYGLTAEGLERCVDEHHPDLIVTVDCGTNADAGLRAAGGPHVDVIVTDHHEIADAQPNPLALAIVNPKFGSDERIRFLAGVGVAFKLCHALIKHAMAQGLPIDPGLDLRDYLDLVAIGTITDAVPLVGENRILARHGLTRVGTTTCPGLVALKEVAGLHGTVTGYDLGFVIGPRINAAGRVGSAGRAIELLLTDDAGVARQLAGELDGANKQRRLLEDEIREDAEAEIRRAFDPARNFGIVTVRENWHPGVIGIVAARLVQRYQRPVIVVAMDEEGVGHGSCRSVEGVDLVELLANRSELLETFGGHKMAAGLKVRATNVETFRTRFNALCEVKLKASEQERYQRVDAWIGLGAADESLHRVLEQLQPFGTGNPAPVFATRAVTLVGPPRVVGKDHLKMSVASGGSQVEAIGFGMRERGVPEGILDVLYNLELNTFRGRSSIQLNVKDFRPTTG